MSETQIFQNQSVDDEDVHHTQLSDPKRANHYVLLVSLVTYELKYIATMPMPFLSKLRLYETICSMLSSYK